MKNLQEFAFDTETNTLRVYGPNEDFSLVGISISWGAYNNYYIPVGHRRMKDLYRNIPIGTLVTYLSPIFGNPDIRIIGQNLKFDMHVMSRIGIEIETKDLFDTAVASWLCDENTPNGLKENSARILGISQTHFKEVTDNVPKEVKKDFGLSSNSKATFDLVLIDNGAPYALDDAFYTWELYQYFMDKLESEKMDKIYYKVYVPFIRTLYLMEKTGVTIDTNSLDNMRSSIRKDIESLEYDLCDLAGVKFNPSSTQQLGVLLFGYAPEKPVHPSETDENWKYHSDEAKESLEKKFYKSLKDWESKYQDLLSHSFYFKVMSTTKKGAPQVNTDTLWRLSKQEFKVSRKRQGVQFCKKLLEYKKLVKLSSAFIEGLYTQMYDDGKVHPSFNIIGTDSGRLSCSNPNLQQLPKADEEDKYQIRSLFIGSTYFADDEGNFICDCSSCVDKSVSKSHSVLRKHIVALDFANLEMRVLAHFSKDKNLLQMFADDADTHGATAVNMFELPCDPSEVKKKYPHLRQAAKVLNFLLMYGGGASTLYESLKGDMYNPIDLNDKSYLDQYHVKNGVEVAQIYIDKYFSTYSGVSEFIKRQKKFAHRNGYVQTLLRRKRRLPGINSPEFKEVAYCERLSVNSAVQGSAADITMSAQNLVSKDPWFKEHGANMIIQVHDELVFECPEKYVEECITRVKHYMEHCFGDNVSLNLDLRADADSGLSYQEAK